MSHLLAVFLYSMTPLGELRVSIPLGILHYHLNPFSVFFVSILGNLIPPIFIFYFFEKLSSYLSKKSNFFKTFFSWWINKAQRNKKNIIKSKIKILSLVIFVGIPLPFTGAWTGTLIAILAGFNFKETIIALITGVFMAGIIVLFLTKLGVLIYLNMGLSLFLGVVFTVLIIFYLIFKLLKSTDSGN